MPRYKLIFVGIAGTKVYTQTFVHIGGARIQNQILLATLSAKIQTQRRCRRGKFFISLLKLLTLCSWSDRWIRFCVALAIIYTVQVQVPNLIMASDKSWLCLILTSAHFVDTGTVNNLEMLKCVVR